MAKIVVIGSCSVDFTTYSPRLPKAGETLHGSKFQTSYGGKGANQCVAASKAGGNAHMICRLGDDSWGIQYKKYLEDLGVNVDHVHITPNTTTGIAQISVAECGENQIVIVPGANNELSLSDVANSSQLIENADVLIGQLETPFATTLQAFKMNKGITLLNAAPAQENIHEILPYCTILCVNESEASMITQCEVNDVQTAAKAISKLLETGCETVIVTLGANGAVYATRSDPKHVHVLCEKVKPVDTTGAGDAFVGSLAAFLATKKNYPLHQLIGAACHIATLSVTKEGTQTSYPSGVDALKNTYNYVNL